jgi:hypothetical protein
LLTVIFARGEPRVQILRSRAALEPHDSRYRSGGHVGSFSVFAAASVMRPIGAYIDCHGRHKGPLVSLALMAVGTARGPCSAARIGLAALAIVLDDDLRQIAQAHGGSIGL